MPDLNARVIHLTGGSRSIFIEIMWLQLRLSKRGCKKILLFRLRIAEIIALRHLRLFIVTLVILLFCHTMLAQVSLTDTDIDETIKFYKTGNPSLLVKNFQTRMPIPVTDKTIRAGIIEQLPATVTKLKITDEKIIESFRRAAAPILKFYGRDKTYEIIVFRHSTPVMFSDTGVVLVTSTGLIERAESDDEFLGYIAHEVGHEFYAPYSIYSRHILKLIAENGREIALNRKMAEAMALIELQCDSFAALTLVRLNYDPLSFINGLEKTARDFPNLRVGFHPLDETRRKLVEGITPKSSLNGKPRISSELKELKKLLK